jgi:hypothetical protein
MIGPVEEALSKVNMPGMGKDCPGKEDSDGSQS